MSSTFSCRQCSATLPAYLPDRKCPQCGCPVASDDTENAWDQPTIQPGRTPPSKLSALPVGKFGDYELIREIARGGMGVVFQARQPNLDRIVALKMILDGQLASQVEIDRFQIEAQAAAHLDHPGIVPVYDNGVIDGRHYFTMAFIEGESLAQRMERGPISEKEAARILLQITEAIDYAHQRGVIHRDLKPANILMDSGDAPRVTDFGLAKRPDKNSGLTVTGQMLGTPSYMAPEQASGQRNESELTDVYALGAILYALLTGKPPFEGATLVETLTKVIEQEPPPLQNRVDRPISPDLETLCRKCLEKDPLERYASAAELGSELKHFLAGEPIEARSLSAWGKLQRWRRIMARNNDVRLRSATKVWGFPLVDIAFGRDHDNEEEFGHARGVLAIGDRATGVFAFGGYARGVFACGMFAIGIGSFGMFGAGIASASMISVAVLSSGGLAFGVYSFGLCAIGYTAVGMFTIGFKSFGAFSWSLAVLTIQKIAHRPTD